MRILIFVLIGVLACGDDDSTDLPDAAPDSSSAGDSGLRDATTRDAPGADSGRETSDASSDGSSSLDASMGDGGDADSNIGDGGHDDARTTDSAVPNDAEPDATPMDTGITDADSSQDGAVVDTGMADAGSSDAAMPRIDDATDNMMDPRQSYGRWFTDDGRFIIAGGFGGTTTPVETWAFDLSTDEWTRLMDLPAPHIGATPTKLPDGRLLLSGGFPEQFGRTSNEGLYIFNPTTDMWSAAGTMTEARELHDALVLHRGPDTGKVVVIGGSRRTMSGADFLASFELYDPANEMSSPLVGTELPTTRAKSVVEELDDGRILIMGGYETPGDPGGSAVDDMMVYDPMDHSVTELVQQLPLEQLFINMGRLPDGRVLLFPGLASPSTAIYALNLGNYTFDLLGNVLAGRNSYGVAYVPEGYVYLFGGRDSMFEHTTNINRYDPVTNDWTPAGIELPLALALIQPTTLPDGRIMLFGGQTQHGFIVGQTSLFTP